MITTSSFPNVITSSKDTNIKRNSLTKEDLEGGTKRNTTSFSQNKNGGFCQNIYI